MGIIIVVIHGIKLALGSIKNRLAASPIGMYGILLIRVAEICDKYSNPKAN